MGDERPLSQRGHGLGPGEEAGLKALRVEAGKDAANGVRRRNAMRSGEEALEP
jgi:hypothetical protein